MKTRKIMKENCSKKNLRFLA